MKDCLESEFSYRNGETHFCSNNEELKKHSGSQNEQKQKKLEKLVLLFNSFREHHYKL